MNYDNDNEKREEGIYFRETKLLYLFIYIAQNKIARI